MPLKDNDEQSCNYCHDALKGWDYRFKGKHYCRKCYDYLFHIKTCTLCNKKRKVFYTQTPPICKFCLVKNKACIRCDKTNYKPGKITEYGPVCNSCAKYYRMHRRCSSCHSNDAPTSVRNLLGGGQELLCRGCYSKTLPVCTACGYRRKPDSYTLDGKALCLICTKEGTRVCDQCHDMFPAGFGWRCQKCTANKTFEKKKTFMAKPLSPYMRPYVVGFSDWLCERRGVVFVSNHLQKYYQYFLQIDKLYDQLGRFPTYQDLLSYFPEATSKNHLLVHTFLSEQGIIVLDAKIKNECAERNLIEKYLGYFEESDERCHLIRSYARYLIQKYENKQTTIRSVRLSLTPAVKFLDYCQHFSDQHPCQEALEGYLWIYPGQRSSLTGFINFLAKSSTYKLDLSGLLTPKLDRAHETSEVLQQRLIAFIQDPYKRAEKPQYYLKTLIGFFHNIQIPSSVYIDIASLGKKSEQGFNIQLCKHSFYLPIRVLDDLK